MARLVNKQFNSPIGLYSQHNIQEVLDRESQILANGAVGIDFRNPDVGKPTNLKNSAVLRMLEEEENRQRNGFGPGNERVIARPLRENIKWPPPAYEEKNRIKSSYKDVVIPGAKRVAWPPPNESGLDSPNAEQNAVQSQGGPEYPSGLQQNNYHTPASAQVQNRTPLKPLDVHSPSGASPLASPNISQTPQGFRPATPVKGWAPVHSPVLSPSQPSWKQPSTQFSSAHQPVSQQTYLGQQYQSTPPQHQYQPIPPKQQYQPTSPQQQQYQSPAQNQSFQHQQTQQYQQSSPQQSYERQYQTTQQYRYESSQQYQTSSQQPYQSPQPTQLTQQFSSSTQQVQSPQQKYQAPQYTPKPEAAPSQVAPRQATKPVEPPPSIITLRPQAPVSQASPPVFNSQPATATLKGGKHLRGDLKWPPENVKSQAEEENRLRIQLAKGPAFRPKRPNKDYTSFFGQHALNSTYPGYKIPPGTQFYKPV